MAAHHRPWISKTLEADTLYGIALVYPVDINYSPADGCTGGAYSQTGNCCASNADLTLLLGSAANPPFESGTLNSPRNCRGQPAPAARAAFPRRSGADRAEDGTPTAVDGRRIEPMDAAIPRDGLC